MPENNEAPDPFLQRVAFMQLLRANNLSMHSRAKMDNVFAGQIEVDSLREAGSAIKDINEYYVEANVPGANALLLGALETVGVRLANIGDDANKKTKKP